MQPTREQKGPRQEGKGRLRRRVGVGGGRRKGGRRHGRRTWDGLLYCPKFRRGKRKDEIIAGFLLSRK